MNVQPRTPLLVLATLCVFMAYLSGLFAITGRLATLGDDSASYLTWAHYFSGEPGPWRELIMRETRFPPVFPLLLALVGAPDDLVRGQQLVVGCLVLSLPLIYHCARQFGLKPWWALCPVLMFCLLPQTWLRQLGVLSETLFVLLSLLALWLANRARTLTDYAWVGAACALALLTRTMSVTLLAAVLMVLLIDAIRERRLGGAVKKAAAVLLPVLLLVGGWYVFRPGGAADQHTNLIGRILEMPLAVAWQAASWPLRAWQEQFALFTGVSALNEVSLLLLGAICVLGTLHRCWRNCCDGWYVLASLAAILVWTVFFPEQVTRLLFPLLPIMLIQGLAWVLSWRLNPRLRLLLVGVLFGIPMAISAMADQLIVQRAQNTEVVYPGWRYADSIEYYQTYAEPQARKIAATAQATLYAFDLMRQSLPTDAVVMWVQPQYIVQFARRRGTPMRAAWGPEELQRQLYKSGATHVMYAVAGKQDDQADSIPAGRIVDVYAVGSPVFAVLNPETRKNDVMLVKIDRERLPRH